MTPTGEISKKLSGLTRWFTNLDIPKRHEDLILWKKYSPDEYPHYDNYDAINVDKVAEIPCDYCESWGLYPEEFETLDKAQWEEVRRERKDDTELIYVVPAKGTELRQALHEHSEGYKEKIEAELANTIYCSGCMGVPITVLDKYNPEQLEIVKFRKGDDEKDLTYTPYADTLNRQPTTDNYALLQNSGSQDTVTVSSEYQLRSLTNGVQNNLDLSGLLTVEEMDNLNNTNDHILDGTHQLSMKEDCIRESLSKRYCNGIMGVPITIIDKLNPKQFDIIGCSSSWMIAGIKGSMPSASFMKLVNKGKVRTGGTPGRSKVCWVDNEGFANVGYHRIFLRKKI